MDSGMHCNRKLDAGNTQVDNYQLWTCSAHHAWAIIFLPLIVFTATISLSVFLRVDLVRRALYTMPNSPAINALVNCVNVLYVLVLEIN